MIEFIGKFHSAIVHFPIALVVTAGLAEFFYIRTHNEHFAFTARFTLNVASACAVAAALLGLAAAGEETSEELRFAFGVHRVAGLVTAGLIVLAAALAGSAKRGREPWRYGLYRLVLLLAVISVWVAGHFGATLVLGPDHFPFP